MTIKLNIRRREKTLAEGQFTERIYNEPMVTVGAAAGHTLCLNGPGLAPEQFVILQEDEQYWLINRADGTLLNGEDLPREARRPLRDGDELEAGTHLLRISLPARSVTSPSDRTPPRRSFAEILDDLRTVEDCFSFVIAGGPQDGQLVLLKTPQMIVGWDETSEQIAFEEENISFPWLLIHKDWSGIVVASPSEKGLLINNQSVSKQRRLRHRDEIALATIAWEKRQELVKLVFYEPAALALLDSLLPDGVPPPVTLVDVQRVSSDFGPDVSAESQLSPASLAPEELKSDLLSTAPLRRYFGYFTGLEVLLLLLATIVLTLLFFLLFSSL